MIRDHNLSRTTPIIHIAIVLLSFCLSLLQSQNIPIAVLDFDGIGISQPEATALSNRLRNELFRLGRFEVVDRGMMENILSEQDFQQAGCTSNDCLVEVGKLLGAQQMVGGSISKVGGTFTVSARLVDVETGKVLNVSDFDIKGELDDLLTRGMAQVAAMLSMINEEIELPAIVSDEETQTLVFEQQPAQIQKIPQPDDKVEILARSSSNYSIGLDAVVVIGKVKLTNDGNIKSILGISPILGIGYKRFFGAGAAPGKINVYLDIGTDFLVRPFFGSGGDYIFGNKANFYVGVNVSSRSLIYFIPIPTINLGVYL